MVVPWESTFPACHLRAIFLVESFLFLRPGMFKSSPIRTSWLLFRKFKKKTEHLGPLPFDYDHLSCSFNRLIRVPFFKLRIKQQRQAAYSDKGLRIDTRSISFFLSIQSFCIVYMRQVPRLKTSKLSLLVKLASHADISNILNKNTRGFRLGTLRV